MNYFASLRQSIRSERGASMLEFAITLPVFMFTIIGIMDFTQVLTVQSLLDEAANRALVRATTVPNFDVNPQATTTDPQSQFAFKRLMLSREMSSESGMHFIDQVRLVHPEGATGNYGRMGELLQLAYTEDRQPGADVTVTSGVIVLQPGDCATVVSTSQVICNRSSLGITESAPRPIGEPADLMKNHPVRVVAVARVNGYLPFWNSRLLIGEAFGYRQPIPQGPFEAFRDPELSVAVGPPVEDLPPPLLSAPILPVPIDVQCIPLGGFEDAVHQLLVRSVQATRPLVITNANASGVVCVNLNADLATAP